MGRDHPDGTQLAVHTEVVGTAVVPSTGHNEIPWTQYQQLTTISTIYQTVTTYTVLANSSFVLYGIELYATPISHAVWQLTVRGNQLFTGKILPDSLNLHYSDARLRAGDIILVEVKSDDGTSIKAEAVIEGKEIGVSI